MITRIANPIYDVVFRYLMEDNKVAKLVLSAITGRNIVELTFNPTSHSSKIGDEETHSITVIHMDFSARIRNEDGTEEVILIELQKAKYYFQTMRFRRYLGKQYQNVQNTDVQERPLPLLPIYILGDSFTKTPTPVIMVKRHYIDGATASNIDEKHPFIEALTHDAIVIQIPFLKDHRRTVLEKFLSIFDQSLQAGMNGHMLEIDTGSYPKRYHSVIRRLNKALQSPQIEYDMDLEDDVINEFNKQSLVIEEMTMKTKQAKSDAEKFKREAENAKQAAESAKQEVENAKQAAESAKQEVENAKQAAESAKQAAESAEQAAENAKQEAESAKQEAESAKQTLTGVIKKLAGIGTPISEIAAITGLSEEEVQQYL